MLKATLLLCILALPPAGAADDDAQKKQAFQACIEDSATQKTAAMQDCANLGSQERAACESNVEAAHGVQPTKQMCLLRSGLNEIRDTNTLAESRALSRENQEREQRAGVSEPAPNRRLEMSITRDRNGNIPVPPRRPDFRPGPTPSPSPSPDRHEDEPARADNKPRPNLAPDRGGGSDQRQAKGKGSDPTGESPEARTGSSIYDNVSLAQSEAQMDVQSCQSKQNSALLCANDPLSCASAADRDIMQRLNAGPANEDGIANYCRQMESTNDVSKRINSRLGATCTSNQYACTNSCADLEQKYRGYMANCENCESYSVFMNAAAQLASARAACGQAQGKCDQLTAQAMNTSTGTAYSQYCQKQAGMSPQSLSPSQMGKANNAYGATSAAGNPTQATNAAASAAALGQGGFGTAPSRQQNKNRFDLQDLADSGFPGMKVESALNAPPTVRAVPNGGGGFSGGTGGGAQLGTRANARTGSGPNVAGRGTEVEQGFRSGGYSQPAGQPNGNDGPSGYDGDRRRPAANEGTMTGLDLKHYLPGGSLDPTRRLAGANMRSEINAKEEDIFRRISLKMYEKCRLGLLWRCD